MFDKNKLLDVAIKKRSGKLSKEKTWQWINENYANGFFTNGEELRLWVRNQLRRKDTLKNVQLNNDSPHKTVTEMNRDGSWTSSKLVCMSEEDEKNPEFLLKAHGFDPEEWELVSVKNSIWTGYSKQDGQFPMYASKITCRPLKFKFSIDRLIESLKNFKPFDIETKNIHIKDKRLLEISIFDPHFGISDYEYYKETQERIYSKIVGRRWEEILFIIGQDTFHNDNFRGQTANGTIIEAVDMVKAWNDCLRFYEPLIRTSLKYSNRVKIIYSKGNHDESMSWSFVQLLKALFPKAIYDDAIVERKVHVFGKNFIGITHGDKARTNLHNIFPAEFPQEWANATNREVHIGHIHVENAKDYFGMMVRTLATRNKTDKYHADHGFIGAHKRFMLFEYSEENLEAIYYV